MSLIALLVGEFVRDGISLMYSSISLIAAAAAAAIVQARSLRNSQAIRGWTKNWLSSRTMNLRLVSVMFYNPGQTYVGNCCKMTRLDHHSFFN